MEDRHLVDGIPETLAPDARLHLRFKDGRWLFDYLLTRRPSEWLIVLMPAAMVRGKRRVPCFHRHSWMDELKASTVCVNDPTVRLHADLLGGWFQGIGEDHLLPHVVRHVATMAARLGVARERIVFAGSSLGGFASLAAATLLRGTRAYAENPQTDLRRYLPGPTALLEQHCFRSPIAEWFERQPWRFSLGALMEREGYVPPMHVVQKASDAYHYREHFLPFARGVLSHAGPQATLEIIAAEADPSGHTPLTKEQFKARIDLLAGPGTA